MLFHASYSYELSIQCMCVCFNIHQIIVTSVYMSYYSSEDHFNNITLNIRKRKLEYFFGMKCEDLDLCVCV